MMRELEQKPLACSYCGAPAEHLRPAEAATGAGLKVWSWSETCVVANAVERQRSGLAYAAGFAGLFYLFHFSFATFLIKNLGIGERLVEALIALWSLSAPLTLILSYAAGASLDRSPEKSGASVAMFGFFVGLFGTVVWLKGIDNLVLNILILR